MRYAIIYTHPNPKSFNHAIKEEVEANLKRAGKDFVTRDLYAQQFNPILDGPDFVAFHEHKLPADIAAEQAVIRDADVLIMVHPIWWFGMPARMKGYIDRVFSTGFAYRYTAKGPEGMLKGKKVFILNTTGGDEATYRDYGFKDAVQKTMEAGTYGFCGLEIAGHHFFYAVPTSMPEQRAAMLETVRKMQF